MTTQCNSSPPASAISWVDESGKPVCRINGIKVLSVNQGNGKLTLEPISAADQAILTSLGFAIGTNGKWETESF